jgi:hypothetical protein
VSHADAALTPRARLRLARLVVDDKRTYSSAAKMFMVAPRTAAKWAARYRGPAAMADHSSRPHRQPAKTPTSVIMWVTMPSANDAARFIRLEDTYGSGDVTPFGTEVLAAGGIHFTGKHCRSRRDGSLVVIAETEPVRGEPSDAFLQATVDVADVLPPL